MTTKVSGLVKIAQLVTCQLTEAELVPQFLPVVESTNIQALLLTVMHAIVVQPVQDGELMLVEMDVTDQERNVDAYRSSMNCHGNVRDVD